MKGVILAAGKSTRMREISNHIPKPLIPIAGRPMLEHTITAMVAAGVDQIILVVNFKHKLIRNHFGDGTVLGTRIHYLLQEQPLGTGHAALTAQELLQNESFMLIFGDIITPAANIKRMVSQFERNRPDALLSVHRVDDPCTGAAVYVKNGRVIRIVEKPLPGTSTTNYDNAGIFVLGPGIFELLKQVELSPRGEYELTDLFRHMIAENKKIEAFELKGFWHNVTSPEELLKTNRSMISEVLKNPSAASIIGSNTKVEDAIIGQNVSIGDNVTIGKNCTFENAIIDCETRIGDDCTIKNAVILKNSRVSAHNRIVGTPNAVVIYS